MSAYPYLPLFTQDFRADTIHLSAQETGAYLLLMMEAWQSPGCCIPDDDRKLARWARVDDKTWRSIKPTVMEFWELKDGQWTQKRLSKERAHVAAVAEKRRAAVRKRWGSRAIQMNKKSTAHGMHPYPYPHPHDSLRVEEIPSSMDSPIQEVHLPSGGIRTRASRKAGGAR